MEPRRPESIRDAAQKVLDRLKATAKNKQLDTRQLMSRYALERFAHRISESPYRGQMVLKGGMLMLALNGDQLRPTEDLDAHSQTEMTLRDVEEFVRTVAATDPSEEDGLEFDLNGLKIETIREELIPGARVTLRAFLTTRQSSSEIKIKLDLAWGDPIFPEAVETVLPGAIKGFEPLSMPAYPWPTVIAEKLHAVARHGRDNTRAKDFYDLLLLTRLASHDGAELCGAVRNTFSAWGGAQLSADLPGLSESYATSDLGVRVWKRFTDKKSGLKEAAGTLLETIEEIKVMAVPVLEAAASGQDIQGRWEPGDGWVMSPSPSFG